VALAQAALADCPNVKALPFDGLIVEFVRAQNAQVIVRGLRSVTDYDYETQMSGMNRHLAPEIDTVFLHTSAGVQHISSTLVREIAKLGGDVSGLVSAPVLNALQGKVATKH
jgi:pantetheine-phosphate adenylyltransferase